MLPGSTYIHFRNTSLNLDEIHCLFEYNACSTADITTFQSLQKPQF